MKKNTRRWLGWTLGAVVLALILFHISRSPQWKDFQWGKLWSLLIHVNLGLLLLAIILSLATLLIRAYRWKFFVDPIKKCSPWVLFNAQALGFSSIYLVGRAGEVVRPAYIAKAEDLPFTSQLAVWAIERIYDGISLVVLFALALYFEPIRASSPHSLALLRRMHQAAVGILILSVLVVGCLIVYRIYSEPILKRLERALERFRLPAKFRNHSLSFLRSFSSGLNVLQDPWDFSASLVCSVLLWTSSVTSLWLMFRSIGGHLAGFGWWAAALTAFLAAVGLAVQLPGVGGGYQVAVLLALKDVFHVPAEGAASGAILTWVTVMAPCVILGLILVASGGLSFKKIKLMVDEEKSEVSAPGA